MKSEITNLKSVLGLKDRFAQKRHAEKVEIAEPRFGLAVKLLDKRDTFSTKRHAERMELLTKRFVK